MVHFPLASLPYLPVSAELGPYLTTNQPICLLVVIGKSGSLGGIMGGSFCPARNEPFLAEGGLEETGRPSSSLLS